MRAVVERYATIGLCGGTGACILTAALHESPLLLPIVIGAVVGTLSGAAYGLLRVRVAR